MRRVPFVLLVLVCVTPLLRGQQAGTPLYAENFEKLPEGEPPEAIIRVNGEFSVKKVDGNGVLELAANPLDGMGILVGPNDLTACTVSARVQAWATGRRMPEFGLAACGPTKYRVWVMPAVGQLQLMNGDEVVAKAPYAWESGAWTRLKLQVATGDGGKVKVRGKAWMDGKDEPKDWLLSFEDAEAPQPGRAGVFATPYSGRETRIDDIVVGR